MKLWQTIAFGILAATVTGAQAGAPEKTASGLVYESVKDGTGAPATPQATVQVHYRGTLVDGREFDSSYKRHEPISFSLGGVIPCWTQGVQKIQVGGKARLNCPADTAYGERGVPGLIPPNTPLTFDVELLAIER